MTQLPVYTVALCADGPAPRTMESPFFPLGCLVAYAKVHAGGLLNDSFDFRPLRLLKGSEAPEWLRSVDPGPAVYALSSYIWNHLENERFARAVRERFPHALILIGGPHVPRQQLPLRDLLARAPFDIAARSEGERTPVSWRRFEMRARAHRCGRSTTVLLPESRTATRPAASSALPTARGRRISICSRLLT